MSKTKNQVIDQLNDKQQAIQYLTDLVATVSNYYLKGRIKPEPLRISESRLTPGQIGIDLYNFGKKPVCDGLNFVPIYFDDGTDEQGFVFAMHYNADEPTPLTFLVDFTNLPEVQVGPEDLPADTLQNIARWLEQAAQEKQQSPTDLRALMDRWAGFCYNHPSFDEVILWMVGGSKQHYLYQHFCTKWMHLCEAVCHQDTMATWIKFYRELDDKWAERLLDYVYNVWKRDEQ